jgi:hypothetical protein
VFKQLTRAPFSQNGNGNGNGNVAGNGDGNGNVVGSGNSFGKRDILGLDTIAGSITHPITGSGNEFKDNGDKVSSPPSSPCTCEGIFAANRWILT